MLLALIPVGRTVFIPGFLGIWRVVWEYPLSQFLLRNNNTGVTKILPARTEVNEVK